MQFYRSGQSLYFETSIEGYQVFFVFDRSLERGYELSVIVDDGVSIEGRVLDEGFLGAGFRSNKLRQYIKQFQKASREEKRIWLEDLLLKMLQEDAYHDASPVGCDPLDPDS